MIMTVFLRTDLSTQRRRAINSILHFYYGSVTFIINACQGHGIHSYLQTETM